MQSPALARPFARPLALAAALAVLPAHLAANLVAQHAAQSTDPSQPMYVAPASAEGQQAIASFQLADGLSASLVAAEPDLCNVVAFAIDDNGRIYVSETFRIHDGVFDTREYLQWKDEDLACLTVADRMAKYQKHIPDDIPKYAAYSERVRLLVDDNHDFTIDRSTVFADQFRDMADGIASGVLPVDNDVWFTNIPKLWRLRDANGDGTADVREAVFDGFGVHTSLIGHDLHGLVLGPDRRLYFSIGDRGFHVATREGDTLQYPHEGAVLRCELDGSHLQVVHRGLRNPQELAFDDAGNLFTGDNNSDGGDRARLVQIVEGADSGWRIGFQWLSDRGAWNKEKMWWPRHPGQPAWILPPIINVCDGPSGLAFDPGAGLPERYRGCLFLCDFRGGSGYSGVHALRLANDGAGFELCWRDKPIWGILATDVAFSPDGALYVSDWVSGWNKTGKGRIYRIEQQGQRNDMQLRASARLLGSDFGDRTDAQLLLLLQHRDRRIRKKAQFALVDRKAVPTLLAAAKDLDSLHARLAGVWGLGILGRRDAALVAPLATLLGNADADVRAQAVKAIADCAAPTDPGGGAGASDKLVARILELLRDPSGRVRREAAIALGKMPAAAGDAATDALFGLLRDNDDRDVVLRHAAVVGLAGTTAPAQLLSRRDDACRAVRLGALLALRHLRDPGAAAFLTDADAAMRLEAARAVYDGGIDPALPQLAATLDSDAASEQLLAWRALNAARLLGRPEHAAAIAKFAADAARPMPMRVEALRILAEWRVPHGQDRVLGIWRPCSHADADAAVARFAPTLPTLLAEQNDLAAAAAEACANLKVAAAGAALAELAAARRRPAGARTAALQALATLADPHLDSVVAGITADDPTPLRTAAVRLFADRAPQKAAPVLATLCEKADLRERQAAFAALGTLADPAGAQVLARWLDAMQQGNVDAAVQLDLLDAAGKRSEAEVQQRLEQLRASRDANDPLSAFRSCIDGGDAQAGRRIFFDNEATRCTRCHTVATQGGNAGPVLDGIGARQPREYLLESLVLPSRQIAQGFATTVLDLYNGDLLAGIVTKDQDGAVEITGVDGESKQVAWDRIKSRRTSADSAMPAMAGTLDLRQLRDVVAFLASLTTPAK